MSVDFDRLYDEFLDEGGMVNIAGLEYYPSAILEAVDPTAYRCGFLDWIDFYLRDFDKDSDEYKQAEEEGYI